MNNSIGNMYKNNVRNCTRTLVTEEAVIIMANQKERVGTVNITHFIRTNGCYDRENVDESQK